MHETTSANPCRPATRATARRLLGLGVLSLAALASCTSYPDPQSPPEPRDAPPGWQAAQPSMPIDPSGGAVAEGVPPPASGLPNEGFVSIGTRGTVEVFRREQRPGLELAAVGTIAASPERVRKVLTDYPSHQRWQKHLKECRILARGADSLDVYQRLDLPVIDDRDFTLHVTWGNENDVTWMRFAAANDKGPGPVRGVVRVAEHQGSWRLEPIDGGRATRAVYRFHIDLAGSVPGWLGKGQAADDLGELFNNVTRQLPAYP